MSECLAKIQRQWMDLVNLGKNCSKKSMQGIIAPNPQAINVYRNTIRISQLRCLEQTYPVCVQLVGNTYFTFLFEQYRIAYPQRNFDLHHYGHTFAAFLKDFELPHNILYLGDVAQLEWAIHHAEMCASEPQAVLDKLARIDPEVLDTLQFQLIHSATLLESAYPIKKIWELNQHAIVEEMIALDQESMKIIVWHNGQAVHFESLQDAEWDFLRSLQKNFTLEQIFDHLHYVYRLQECEAQTMLAKFLHMNCLHISY
ncbi:MAG TPA: DNA-binding domain-containing protein [Gammaproteobacteria bacterium]|nr:DNA-binding domain-containing protein [Gammaproteobacteria bacterium]